MAVLNIRLDQFKTSAYEIARTLLKSRRNLAAEVEQLNAEIAQLKRCNEELQQEQRRLQDQAEALREVQEENESLKQKPISLPADLAPKGHSFGAKMIAMLIEVAKRVGFASASKVVRLVFDFLNIEAKLPTGEAIRTWARRIGIHLLEDGEQSSDDEYWIADHSAQVGGETLLTISRLRMSDLPAAGETLSRDKLKVIHVLPGKHWTRDKMRDVYRELTQQRGKPAGLLTDGAVELFESADVWAEKGGKNPVRVVRDIKHLAANSLERLVGKSDRFKEFTKLLGQTRSQVQQTELAAFTPPRQKTKARFMNLGPTLDWADMASWHLSQPHSKSRKEITADRMNEKLGWLRSFRHELACWVQCEAVMTHCLGFYERHAVESGSTRKLEACLDETFGPRDQLCEIAGTMRDDMLAYCRDLESDLEPGERVWTLTDNLESIFGGFKQLERQQSKGGFTSLIAALPLVNTTVTPDLVRTALTNISVKRMKAWTHEKLGTTLTAKRQLAYAEATAKKQPSGPKKTK
ncbi:MAG: hypothetical protein KDB27_03025 [Planctomycetales bacterium]|nr:hypothetical protein [Planctomycetales bacterium]